MKAILLSQRWSPDNSRKVEALMMTDPDLGAFPHGSPYVCLQRCTYDPNNASDTAWEQICTGSPESVLMTAHSILFAWGITDESISDLGTLIAKRQADQRVIEQAIIQMRQNG